MVEYKCNKCGKIFSNKTKYTKHQSRKFPCQSDEGRENNADIHPAKSASYAAESAKNQKPIALLDANRTNKSKEYKCTYCSRSFTRSDSLNKHLAGRCKVRKQQDNDKEELLQKLIEQMNKQNSELVKQMGDMKEEIERLKSKGNGRNNSTNIGTQQNTTIENQNNQQNIQINNNNIKLLAFGSEDMSYVVDEVYKKILNKGFKSVPTFVQYLHFNKDKPQNHNVYISNMQTNYAIVYDGEDWKLKERDDVLQQLVDDKTGILSIKFDELLGGLDEPTIRKFKRFIDQSDENEVVSQMKSDLKLVLYNNRKIAERTKQQLYPQIEPKMIEVQ
jgi:DNA-directed RNA polymerase subunit RPC12/RpoP